MGLVLCVVQGVLALMFVLAGIMKSTQARENLIKRLSWVEDVPTPVVRLIGTAELLGGLGLILPAATGMVPFLAPVAALCLALIMLGAMVVHRRRNEVPAIALNAMLLLPLLVIAWARLGNYGN